MDKIHREKLNQLLDKIQKKKVKIISVRNFCDEDVEDIIKENEKNKSEDKDGDSKIV